MPVLNDLEIARQAFERAGWIHLEHVLESGGVAVLYSTNNEGYTDMEAYETNLMVSESARMKRCWASAVAKSSPETSPAFMILAALHEFLGRPDIQPTEGIVQDLFEGYDPFDCSVDNEVGK